MADSLVRKGNCRTSLYHAYVVLLKPREETRHRGLNHSELGMKIYIFLISKTKI